MGNFKRASTNSKSNNITDKCRLVFPNILKLAKFAVKVFQSLGAAAAKALSPAVVGALKTMFFSARSVDN